jgi:hypothetical protein
MKFLKFLAIITTLLLAMTMMTLGGGATSPRYIGLKYDAQTHMLNIKVVHFSPAPKIHYVYRVEIDINGETIQAHLYTSQPRILLLSYTYNITINPGDTLTVSAYCVLWGNLQKSETITKSMTIS